MSSNPVLRQQQMPTLAESDAALDAAVASSPLKDANDVLYRIEASFDYDPGPRLRVPHPHAVNTVSTAASTFFG
jgi:homoserine O-acetyltransferase/O-succinyltransferase